MTDQEIWLPIAGFEGYYEVSSHGRVKSLTRVVRAGFVGSRHTVEGILTPIPDRDGYPRVILRVDGGHVTRRLHRLVCEAFNGPAPEGRPEAHHLDSDRANARADNLAWVSRSENMAARSSCSVGEKNGYARLSETQVRAIRAERGTRSVAEIAAGYGVSIFAIYDIHSGRRWKHVR